jgi:hypothetical protein
MINLILTNGQHEQVNLMVMVYSNMDLRDLGSWKDWREGLVEARFVVCFAAVDLRTGSWSEYKISTTAQPRGLDGYGLAD